MRKGDTSAAVTQLQRQLNSVGLNVTVDGWFGVTTEAAVIAFQRRAGLVADGVAGEKTLFALQSGYVDNLHLRQIDLETAAQRLGVPVASVMAVNAVESNGPGFLTSGRPVILFERHQLYRLLDESDAHADLFADRYPALVNKKRGGYVGGAGEWARLANARQITADYPTLAEQACSWGAFQIMAYHWERLGYDSAEAFVAAMHASEAAQLGAFVRYIEADPALLKALKARKWADFARLYNGPAYRDNFYDVKMARAYDKFSVEAALPEAA